MTETDAHWRQRRWRRRRGDDRDGTGGIVESTEQYRQGCRGRGMVAAVHSQRGTVSERVSAYECSFQGQPYMGHYSAHKLVIPPG
jgi:hypothetical protein